MRKFKYAGVSKVKGRFTLRATNRELPVYPEILERDKNTHINIIKLPRPMSKDQARELLARRKEFRKPEILAVLKKEGKATVKAATPAKKSVAAKKRSAPKAAEKHTETASAAA